MKRLAIALYLFTLSAPVVSLVDPVEGPVLSVAEGLLSAFCTAEGQTTYNLEIIWQNTVDNFEPGTEDSIQNWGESLSGGDFDGDGYSDMAVGYIIYDDSGPWDSIPQPRVNIYRGASYPDTLCDRVLYLPKGPSPITICTGDYNHDGYMDLATATCGPLKGAVLVFYGKPAGLTNPPDVFLEGTPYSGFGMSITTGDINGDGVDDLIVGSPYYMVNNTDDGRIYVYYGDTLGLHTTPNAFINGGLYDSQEQFGMSLASGGDLNDDGYDDILVGARSNSEAYYMAGKIYIYFGGDPMDTTPDGWVHGEGPRHFLGWSSRMAIVKLNNKAWACIGNVNYPGGYDAWSNNGKVYMLKMAGAWDTIPDLVKIGEDSLTNLGRWVANLGCLGSDSLEELGIAKYNEPGEISCNGIVEVWPGRWEVSTERGGYARGRWIEDHLYKMGPAGDVDGDGRGEFLFSNPMADTLRTVWLAKYSGPEGVAGPSTPLGDRPQVKLFQNSPNPFSSITQIRYHLTKANRVKVDVYNISGQLVAGLVNEYRQQGVHEARWNGKNSLGNNCSPGVYICKLETGGSSTMRKMLLIK